MFENTAKDLVDSPFSAKQIMEHHLGAEGMAMLDEQLALWQELNSRELSNPLRDRLLSGDTKLPKGTLLHSTGRNFDEASLRSIAENGILSGELVGHIEDSETHACADFYRVSDDTDFASYLRYASTRIHDGIRSEDREERRLLNGVMFIVGHDTEGLSPLLEKDGYRDEAMKRFVRPQKSRTSEDTAAVLGGVPRGAISGIAISERLAAKEGFLALLQDIFPNIPIMTYPLQRPQ